MRFDLTVNHFTMELLTQKRLIVFGEQFWRPYVHVRDVARAVSRIIAAPADKVCNNVFNIGSTDQNYQKQSLVELIQPYAPDARIEYVHKEEDPRDYRVSFEKIKNMLDFETVHSVEDGICEVAQLVRDGVIRNIDNPNYRNHR